MPFGAGAFGGPNSFPPARPLAHFHVPETSAISGHVKNQVLAVLGPPSISELFARHLRVGETDASL
ncbi:MAG: hypothetical protein HYX53_11475 [Chloroflexi bacterium]|nr:hypothetical protein [Chloroflexota bacterium]